MRQSNLKIHQNAFIGRDPHRSAGMAYSLKFIPICAFIHYRARVERNYYYYIRLTAFSRTTWVSRHQKGKPFWILLKQV